MSRSSNTPATPETLTSPWVCKAWDDRSSPADFTNVVCPDCEVVIAADQPVEVAAHIAALHNAFLSPAPSRDAAVPASGGVFREKVKQVRYHWEVIQGQCSDGDGFTERAAMDLELAIDALEAALSSAPATPSPAEAEAKEGRADA